MLSLAQATVASTHSLTATLPDVARSAVCAIAFGGDKTVSSGTFTIQFPVADASNAIIRIA